MAIRDKDKRNEYQKNLMRERRAREKLGKPASERAATGKARAVASVTVTSKSYDGPLDMVERLQAFDMKSLGLGERMLNMAERALDFIDIEELGVLDIKRLAELGLKLKERSAEKLTREEERTEQAIFVTEKVVGNPEALGAIHKLLTFSAADDLDRCVDGSGARPADSIMLRALHEQTGVDPVPAPPSS